MNNLPIKRLKDDDNDNGLPPEPTDNLFPLLKDVYGDEEFKTELDDIVLSMQNQFLYMLMGTKQPQTYLFTGEPGTGKTFSTKAIANELKKTVYPQRVILAEYKIGELGTAYINMGSINLQKFFNKGLDVLTNPKYDVNSVIYFFDEVDAVMGKRRGLHSHKEDDKLLETLMKNLQEINDRGENEYVFMATNYKDALDSASIRSGRVNKQIEFKLPNDEARYNCFKGIIKKINDRADYQVMRNINYDELTTLSKGISYADIEAVIDNALDRKIKKEMRVRPKGLVPAYYIKQKWLKDSLVEIKKNKDYDTKTKIGFIR